MNRAAIMQARRNQLLVGLLGYIVEIGNGVAPALLPDGRYVTYRREDVRQVEALVRRWFEKREELAQGGVPRVLHKEAAAELADLQVEIESHWPAARVLREEYLDAEFIPTYVHEAGPTLLEEGPGDPPS